jgi:prepilin-type N-terminal cleavage/methylation domain-containing protein
VANLTTASYVSQRTFYPLQQGFTLLEMVLVLFLMAMIASAALFLTENVEDQVKFEDTRARMEAIRMAIVGDTSRSLNGETELRGFVMDMGRLPECIRELIDPQDCNGNALPLWQYDDANSLAYGWNGPYLQATSESDGDSHFRDGYRNVGADAATDDLNSGWSDFTSALDTLSVTSNGVDGSDAADDITDNALINPNDHQVDLGSDWQTIPVSIDIPDNANFSLNADSLRLYLVQPVDGDLPTLSLVTAEQDLTLGLSEAFPAFQVQYTDATDVFSLTVAVGDSIDFSPAVTLAGTQTQIDISSDTVATYNHAASGQSLSFYLDATCGTSCLSGLANGVDEADGMVNSITFNATPTITISNLLNTPLTFVAPRMGKPWIQVLETATLAGTTITLLNGATITIPVDNDNGIDQTIITFTEDDDANGIVDADADITVSEAFTMVGNRVITDTSGDVFYVPSGTTQVGNTLTVPARLAVSMGQRSLVVLCDANNAIFTGFDAGGACENDSADAQPDVTTLKFVPRAISPSIPNPLVWTIQ